MAITPQQVIDLVVAFEKDLATFYKALQLKPNLKPLEGTCRFMAQHSEIHAEMIANYRSNADIPQLQTNPLATLHERLKTSLEQELATTDDVAKAADKIAQAEDIISQAYAKIADHYSELADTYQMIAGKFRSLAEDERQHRDYVHREYAKLGPAATAPSADRQR
jgi:DNA phosphorothioation-dependent restriction protein DptG